MASPLVATKLFMPKLREGIVERHRLSERLKRGAGSRLTLISAPAGFGKTTLLAQWLAAGAGDRTAAWLSLDQTDNDPASFWSHVIAALETAAPEIGETVVPILQSGQPAEAVLASLINALTGLSQAVDLVLDDYHLIDHPDIAPGVVFLLEHLPAHVHVVISTRSDPALPLARFRARGELVEIRSADLRFTEDEASVYLNVVAGLGLSHSDVVALEGRTEGWIAALQLAALSINGRDDAAAFIAGFAGNDRYIFDYLVEEVLLRQSDEVRGFLLQTCFLDRLSGPLCDAVTGIGGSRAMLEALDRENLFVVPLDDRRQWYRYHHLFADVLLTHFADEVRPQLPVLHRRASDWYELQGERLAAIQHRLAGGDLERAAGLIELALPDLQKNRGEASIRHWAQVLPRELVRNRPVLGIGLVGGLVSSGAFEGIGDRLLDVEFGISALADAAAHSPGSSPNGAGIVVVDKGQLPRLPAAVELYRTALAQVRGDVAGIIKHAQRVLELAQADDHLARAAGASLLGIAYWSLGELDAARLSWTEGKAGLQRAGHISDMLGVSIALADIHQAQGHLREAAQVLEQGLQLATAPDGAVLRGTPDMHAGLSAIFCERNDLEAAHRHLSISDKLGEKTGLPQHPYRWRVAMAQLRQSEGDLEGAALLLDEAVRVYVGDFFPNVRPLAAVRARLWIVQGRLEEARRWQHESGLGVDDEPSYLREFEHITLARLLLAEEAGDASQLLGRLLEAADRGGRPGSVIEISILKAIASRHSDIDMALIDLERALTLAAPEGYARLFLDEGQPMAALLKVAVKRRIVPVYANKLLAAYGAPEQKPQTHPDLIEPLSDRELDVLRLLRSDLDGPDIARELGIALNTMRTHTKNIFEKLGVNNRRSAVHRAEELSLLAHRQPE